MLVAPSKDRFLEVTGGQHQCPMQFTELLKVEDEAFLVRCELGDALLMRLYDAEDVQHTTRNKLALAGFGDLRELVAVEQAD